VPHNELRVSTRATRLLAVACTAILAAIVAGAVLLWPSHLHHNALTDAIEPADLVDATVVAVSRGSCEAAPDPRSRCSIATVRLTEGIERGRRVVLPEESDADVTLDAGDEIVVAHYPDAGPGLAYVYADHQRSTPLLALVALFAVALIAVGRWRGLRAIAGLGAGIAVLTAFVLPALLDGAEPTLVAMTAGAAIALAWLVIVHGVRAGSMVALVGACAGLALVGALSWAAVELVQLSGASEGDLLVTIAGARVTAAGLVLAGIVVGATGFVVDIAVQQVATVAALRRADPGRAGREVRRDAMRTGRDRLASMTVALTFAYAGASLPMLLLLTQSNRAIGDTATSEVIAIEVVRALVGAIGLVAVVPITTMLAAAVSGGRPPEPVAATADPRRYRSRVERSLWEEAAAAAPAPSDRPDRAL
jgi:uncharacterized membrane protein